MAREEGRERGRINHKLNHFGTKEESCLATRRREVTRSNRRDLKLDLRDDTTPNRHTQAHTRPLTHSLRLSANSKHNTNTPLCVSRSVGEKTDGQSDKSLKEMK